MPERHVFSQDSKIMALNDDDILWQEVFIVVCPLFGTMVFHIVWHLADHGSYPA
jgi:hypothetical protein